MARVIGTIMHLGCIEETVLSAYVCYGSTSMGEFHQPGAAGVEDVMMWKWPWVTVLLPGMSRLWC